MKPLPDSVYTVLKWLCIVFLPAAATCFYALDQIFGWGLASTVCGVIAAVTTCLGTIIGVSSAEYNRGVRP